MNFIMFQKDFLPAYTNLVMFQTNYITETRAVHVVLKIIGIKYTYIKRITKVIKLMLTCIINGKIITIVM